MLNRFLTDRSGNFAMIMGIMMIPLCLAVGLSIDYTRYVGAKTYLQSITDAAAIAMASSSERDQEKLKELGRQIIAGNLNNARIENVAVKSINLKDEQVDLALSGNLPTTFMALAGYKIMPVETSALAMRLVSGSVEVALVLDNTESMNYDNKIQTLKTAAGNLVTQLHANTDADVRIGLVPYAEQINVGMANRKASWLSVPDDYSNTVTTTTTKEGYWNQKTKKKTPENCLAWKEAGSKQVEKDGVWVTESWPRSCTSWEMVNDGDPVWVPEKTTTTSTTTTYKWRGCVGMRVTGSKLILNDGSANVLYPGLLSKNKAFKCLTEIVPLTDNGSTIQKAITGMITSRGAPDYDAYAPNTYIPGGMMWGINLLSKTAPYTEGREYDPQNADPRKVIVLMTDGLNTMRINTTGLVNTDYLKSGTFIGDTNTATAAQRTATNTDTTTLCTYAKSNKIEIFTVAFKVDDAAAKAMLEGCATDKSHYYDASDPAALLAAFSGIGQSLSQVRLAR